MIEEIDIKNIINENERLKALLEAYKGHLKREHYKAYRSQIVGEKQARIDELEKENQKLKEINKFLMSRDNKLQILEQKEQ